MDVGASGRDRDALYKVAYEEAVRALSEQLSLIESLRSRAGLLLSVTTITTSFLSTGALNAQNPSPASWIALASFIGVAVLLIAILWPHPSRVTAEFEPLIESWIEADEPISTSALYRGLIIEIQRSFDRDWQWLSRLAVCFQVASSLLVVEVLCWVAAITPTF